MLCRNRSHFPCRLPTTRIIGDYEIDTSLPSALQPEAVGDGDGDVLLRPEVSFGGLDGGVSEQELDLFEVAAEFAAELGTCPSQVMGAEAFDACE